MHTILSIVGARPQFIKHATVQRELQQHFRALTLHTGQHYDDNMSRVFFEELNIPAPDYPLQITPSKGQGEQTAKMMTAIEEVCQQVHPDAVLVYGDTNTTLAGALVAIKLSIPVFHVEAGIRGYNRALPEEINRVIADTFAALLFCPTQEAVDNLHKEGIMHDGVMLTGDVMCDLLEKVRDTLTPPLSTPYYFATIHRPYNTDVPGRMERILNTLNQLDHPVYFPLHPRTQSALRTAGLKPADFTNIRFSDPVSYLQSLSFQSGAACIITDSSGVQKEAYMLHRKCITLRTETEWNDTLRHGWNTLVFEDIERIPELTASAAGLYVEAMFGNGRAAEAIAAGITRFFERPLQGLPARG
jgi:UDP-GlcNAc3NAcA epimerase